jgi:hypothetical protein
VKKALEHNNCEKSLRKFLKAGEIVKFQRRKRKFIKLKIPQQRIKQKIIKGDLDKNQRLKFFERLPVLL